MSEDFQQEISNIIKTYPEKDILYEVITYYTGMGNNTRTEIVSVKKLNQTIDELKNSLFTLKQQNQKLLSKVKYMRKMEQLRKKMKSLENNFKQEQQKFVNVDDGDYNENYNEYDNEEEEDDYDY